MAPSSPPKERRCWDLHFSSYRFSISWNFVGDISAVALQSFFLPKENLYQERDEIIETEEVGNRFYFLGIQ